jgi:pyruvate, orthophosphate dikinase
MKKTVFREEGIMANPVNICSLDYLIGTIATAYKGMITSLVAKDFCITEEEAEITFEGTILLMPAGKYEARLMHQGSELARTYPSDGRFLLKAEAGLITQAKNLQIDIVQNGRHIGTFLLKREKKGESFFSATELSEELRGMDLKRLTDNIQGKVGLLKKAEDIVSKILSPKKDWAKFSEEINSFAYDVFWAERDTFCNSYPILARYSRLACENLESEKPLSNFLSLIELPFEKEEDNARLRSLAAAWLGELKASVVDLGLRPEHSQRVLKSIHEKFPDMDIGFALVMLISALGGKIAKLPVIGSKVLNALKSVLPDADYDILAGYGEGKRKELMRSVSGMESLLAEGRHRELLAEISPLNGAIPDEKDMVNIFFVLIERNLRPESADTIAEAVLQTFEDFRMSSPSAALRAAAETPGFIRKLVGMGLPGICGAFLRRMAGGGLMQGDAPVLDPGMAQVLLDAGDEDLLRAYTDALKKIIIPAPRVSGFSSDTWAEIADPLHIERLRKFMRIIALDNTRFRDLLVHVICNLFVSGVFIPDESLFQREISAYLNSGGFENNFLLTHLLLQRLPVYFNDVGATGRIRDYTTEIDSWGNDAVLYFLRKQVHVNASNYNVRLIGQIMECWAAEDPSLLRGAVPEDVLQKLDRGLLSQYASVVHPLFESIGLLAEGKLYPERLLGIKAGEIRRRLAVSDTTDEIRSKVLLLCRLYQEVLKKYSPATGGVEEGDIYERLPHYIERIKELKGVITAPEKTRPEESLYFKRHIAFGIPSVMGSYHEPKFNAMGELLRNEDRVRVIFEKIAAAILEKRGDFGKRDPDSWINSLAYVNELFHLFGLGNFQVDELLTIFRTNRLYRSQIADMLKLWRKELTWIVEYFYRTFYKPLTAILEAFPKEALPGRLRGIDPKSADFGGKAANIIMRDILGSIAGPVELDKILDRLIAVFMSPAGPGVDLVFDHGASGETKMEFLALDELGDSEAMKLAPLIGTKAKNLAYLRNKGLPVPPGIVFLSKGADNYEGYTESTGFAAALKRAVEKMEEKAGAFFGGGGKPLFLSVRSGSYISMPGILSSILYCGMNGRTIDAYIAATGNAWPAWDSYRRFLFHYGTVVHGLDAEVFEDISNRFFAERGIKTGEDLKADEMKRLAGLYAQELERRGLAVPGNVYDQLKEAVKAVYRSWHSVRAGQFRKALQVSEHWGTSVILMQMVAGNNSGAGASVFFTRKPSTMEKGVFGDTRERATGDDLAYGRLTNRPLTRQQALAGQESLEETDPELFSLHRDLAGRIEEAMRGLPQEVEVTYVKKPDGKRLIYVLQTRRMEFHRGFTKRFQDVCRMEESIIGRGAGVHGGALSGLATFTSSRELLRKMREELNMPLLLLRKSASTDDVSLMPEVDGILTSAGGATSHASILAQKFDLTAVVGCSDMVIRTDDKGDLYATIGTYTVTDGALISIDGSTGLVYSGSCPLPGADPP